ncbi:hypothetical protein, partial [Comamonas resistens]|uniref:hypothetical protein n=1 Tax=Comamonas resistens TaxID=3046670 RepID=UPI0039BCF79B
QVRVSGGHLCNLPGVQALHFGVETAQLLLTACVFRIMCPSHLPLLAAFQPAFLLSLPLGFILSSSLQYVHH